MNQSQPLENFIRVYKKAISSSICNDIIKKSEKFKWEVHEWTTYSKTVKRNHESRESSVSYLDGMSTIKLSPIVQNAVAEYASEFKIAINEASRPRLNRYDVGSLMSRHHDHIYSLFDGKKKGIPVLSVVGLLNDNYSGGDFIFYDDHKINLQQGDILIFPSVFLYPHRVDNINSGTRYSFVQWIY